MSPTFSSVKDFLDRQRRRASLTNTELEDIIDSTTAENGDRILTVRVADSEQEETVDTSDVAPRDIDRLRSRDPFLYYSIQNDRRKRSCCDFEYDWAAAGDADASGGGVPARRGSAFDNFDFGEGSNTSSFTPTANPRQARRHSVMATTTNIVKRQRRLSTETHPSLMYESMMAEFSDLDGPDIVLDDVEEEEMIPYLRDE
jgi:hypothetical protein